jgi:hypothetical protein
MKTRETKQDLRNRTLEKIDQHRQEIIALGQDSLKPPEVGFSEARTADLAGRNKLEVIPDDDNRGHSTDLGDLSHIMPALGFNVDGVSGRGHENDYLVTDWDTTVIDLLYDNAATAREVVDRANPLLTRQCDLLLQRERSRETTFDGTAE